MQDFTNAHFISHVLDKLGFHKMSDHALAASHRMLDYYASFIFVIARHRNLPEINNLMEWGGYVHS